MWFGKQKEIYVKKDIKPRWKKRGSERAPASIYRVNTRISDKKQPPVKFRLLVQGGLTLLVLGAAIGMWWGVRRSVESVFQDNSDFELREIETFAGGRLSRQLIEEYSGVQLGSSLLRVPLDDVRRRLEDIPLVSYAEARIQLPGKLVLEVHERKPIARLGRDLDGNSFLADVEGKIVLLSRTAEHLPQILGVNLSGMRVGGTIDSSYARDALRALHLIEQRKLSHHLPVTIISVGDPHRLDIRLKNRVQVLVDRSDLALSLDRAAAAQTEASLRNLTLQTIEAHTSGVQATATVRPPPSPAP